MSLPMTDTAPPVSIDPDRVVRVAGTRVTLDTVVEAPEEIQQQYSSLGLGDIYGAIAYYLNHRGGVAAYMEGAPAPGRGGAERDRRPRRPRRVPAAPAGSSEELTAVLCFAADENFNNVILRGAGRSWTWFACRTPD